MSTFKKYWPWWVAIIWLCIFEIYALISPTQITLSKMVWNAQYNFPGLTWIVLGASVILLLHFFVPKFSHPDEKY